MANNRRKILGNNGSYFEEVSLWYTMAHAKPEALRNLHLSLCAAKSIILLIYVTEARTLHNPLINTKLAFIRETKKKQFQVNCDEEIYFFYNDVISVLIKRKKHLIVVL